uniref:Uncharacterized protein n=1 Tax=Strigamia maritima TaxID=126957 RepID=T1JPB4_STRMM
MPNNVEINNRLTENMYCLIGAPSWQKRQIHINNMCQSKHRLLANTALQNHISSLITFLQACEAEIGSMLDASSAFLIICSK